MQVKSRMRGGGKHKDKRNKAEKKQATNPDRPEQQSDESSATMDKDEVLRRLNEDEGYRKIIERISEGSVGEVQQKEQSYLTEIQKLSWLNKKQLENLEGGVWRAVEARRKGREAPAAGRARAKHWTRAQQARQARVGRSTSRTGRKRRERQNGTDARTELRSSGS